MLLIFYSIFPLTATASECGTRETTPSRTSAVFVCRCLDLSSRVTRTSWGAHRARTVSQKYIPCPRMCWGAHARGLCTDATRFYYLSRFQSRRLLHPRRREWQPPKLVAHAPPPHLPVFLAQRRKARGRADETSLCDEPKSRRPDAGSRRSGPFRSSVRRVSSTF